MTDPILDIRNLSVDYDTSRGTLHALRDVTLQVPKGKIVGIVGESGCGKSTLISAIIRLMAPNARFSSGTIDFKGRDILPLAERQVRDIRGREITMVFQDPMTSLNPVLSIGTQMIDIQYRDRLSRREKRRRAVEMLTHVGIPDPEARLKGYPHEFSGGMRQRIAIAMALMAQPDLLIADEPTTALDATLEVQVINRLKALQADVGCSILFISHHLGVIAELCDHVVVMYAGEIVEQGGVRDVFHRARHPYTKALLECDPGRIRRKTRVLPAIPGEVPDLTGHLQGCIFQARCPQAMAICRSDRPDVHILSDGHRAACHLLAPEAGQ